MLVRKNQKTYTGRSFAQFEGVQIDNLEMNTIKGGQSEQAKSGIIGTVVSG